MRREGKVECMKKWWKVLRTEEAKLGDEELIDLDPSHV
jgi:hypothetical protein